MNRRTFIKASLTATAAVAGSVLLDGPLSSASAVTVPNTTEDAKMKILVLTGSPRKNGNSNTLAEHFIPMYYFGISAQLKTVIDRFYAINGEIHIPKKAMLMMTYANNSPRNESPILTYYEVLLEYLGWKDAGRIIVPGVWPTGAINQTPFPAQAFALGKSV